MPQGQRCTAACIHRNGRAAPRLRKKDTMKPDLENSRSFAMTLVIGYVLWRDIVSAYRFNLAFAAEYRQMERQLAMQVEYADQLAQRSDENRRLIHDFRQHLRTITELAGQIESRPETEEHRRELLRYLEDFPAVLA